MLIKLGILSVFQFKLLVINVKTAIFDAVIYSKPEQKTARTCYNLELHRVRLTQPK